MREIDRVRTAMEASPYSVRDHRRSTTARPTGPGACSGRSSGIRVIRFAKNRGAGSARKAGTTAARGRVVVWTDVDMTYPNDEIPQLVKELDG